ncbi:MAG: glycoside hydrolase family 95 protein [Mariniphaga sp.]|nr:glycoside hydrolase family 95 protein [Mariniphaga sp.]
MKNRLIFIALIFVLFSCSEKEPVEKGSSLKLWYSQPATEWEEALPVGNGSLGGMIYGIPGKEKIVLNEESIWSGHKMYDRDKKDGHKYVREIQQMVFDGKYMEAERMANEKLLSDRFPSGSHANQMLGYLFIESKNTEDYTNYRRELDLNNSIVSTTFDKEGVQYFREVFSSYPDQVMVVRYGANKAGSISFSSWVERNSQTEIKVENYAITISEHVSNGDGVKLHSIINYEVKGGSTIVEDGKIVIEGATEVIIRIVAATDYRGNNPEEICMQRLRNTTAVKYEKLLQFHVDDYQELFNRVVFELTKNDGEDLPTDLRLENVKNGFEDDYLTQLQYQFGRYLLISSSRPGSMPSNLQGIWVDGFNPPWNADYHININVQMNYWLSEITNLTECHVPFLEFVGELREMGRITAKETYGARGFVAHHTSDAWHFTACTGNAQWGMWPMGAAWSCQHLFMHYEFTENKTFLEEYAYPVMKEAAIFFVDLMVKNPNTGMLVSGPSISPENRFLTADGQRATMNMGPTMDKAIISELFANCIAASEILDIDNSFRDTLEQKLAQMPPLQIGSDGRLMEWVEEFEEPEPGHRHISHLYALHPSNQITKQKTPELFEAAKKSIEYRLANGGGHTGWSRAWIINFWARLFEANKAYQNVIALQRNSTLSNLFDNHPPFQIDGNFGVVSGITEMLMQSHAGEIHILPALPDAWPSGKIKGIMARGGFKIDIEWSEGKLQSLNITSKLGNMLNLRYGETVKTFDSTKGEEFSFNGFVEEI